MSASIAIVQRIVPHYRLPFFSRLQRLLGERGTDLTLYYGQEFPGTVPRGVEVDAPWAVQIQNRYWRVGAAESVWQPCFSNLREFDLVVVEQANRLLLNSALQLGRRWLRPKLAFWGHGRNLQANGRHLWREAVKRRQASAVDWWFAYTDLTKDYLIRAGFPLERITTVNNTIDATGLKAALGRCDHATVSSAKSALGMGDGPIAVYCGGLYGDKRIDFLLEAGQLIQSRLPDFRLLVIGEGPEAPKVANVAATVDWLDYLGPIYGVDRAVYLKLADVMLMPGAVGLVVIDSFVAEAPLVTTDIQSHGPEIAYLVHGVNGMVSPDSVAAYADAVVEALQSATHDRLRGGCRSSAQLHSIDKMVENFATGVQQALEQ